MKHARKAPLWYNPEAKDSRRRVPEDALSMAVDKERRALLDSYWRLYLKKL